MHTKPFSLARQIFLVVAAMLGLFMLTGCDLKLTNLTLFCMD